jgi:hypothetical protein
VKRWFAVVALLLVGALPVQALGGSVTKLQQVSSSVNPFHIAYPVGWLHTTGHLPGAYSPYQYDAFKNPVRTHGIAVNVLVSRIPAPAPNTDSSTLKDNEADLRATYHNLTEVGHILIAGHHVTLISYHDQYDHLETIFVQDGWAWLFGLTTARGDQQMWQPMFASMLRSFHLQR